MTTTVSGADLAAPSHHATQSSDPRALILGLMFLGWVAAVAGAFVLFGLGGVITAATVTAWGLLALLVVMTAGG